MANKPNLRVSDPPPKPLLIWDGECRFCRLWIERWRDLTAGQIDYVTYQEIGERFSEIPRDQFSQSMVLIEPDGQVFVAAEAVYRSLRSRSSRQWMTWCYEHVPGFAPISETGYKIIARHRYLGSKVTRLLWGEDVRPPTYCSARKYFLRGLGLVYLIAFISLWIQVVGLVGENGIWPIKEVLQSAHSELGPRAYWLLPTLCWLNPSDFFLHFLCAAGVVISLLLILEIAPALSLALLFVDYISLTTAGQTFLSFQWDILLLEAGFLAIFLAPWRIWPRGAPVPISRPALFLLKLLLFKLMFMSGVVKLTSGDPSWGWEDGSWHWSLATALDYHYWTQPLPTVFAWWADKSPEWFKHLSVAVCLVIEIVVPFFIWAPRRLRLTAAALLIFLQIAIAITGNYCFFNLLTVVLCFLLIDDKGLRHGPALAASLGDSRAFCAAKRLQDRFPTYASVIVIIVTFPVNLCLVFSALKTEAGWPRPLGVVYGKVEPLHIVNGYGLFRVMTKDRLEIVIEGSTDGVEWQPYEFRWKPGDVTRPPRWCAPHQPRLDWQMWFAALSPPQNNPWLIRTMVCLLEGKREVENLLVRNPFANSPPQYIRSVMYRYRFTTSQERRLTGAWWTRQESRGYTPAFSLDQIK